MTDISYQYLQQSTAPIASGSPSGMRSTALPIYHPLKANDVSRTFGRMSAQLPAVSVPDVPYPRYYSALGWLVLALIILGASGPFIGLGALSGVPIAIGFTLWAVLGRMIYRRDRSSLVV